MDYKAVYYQLAAKIADAVELLISAQQQCENNILQYNDEAELILLNKQQGVNKKED